MISAKTRLLLVVFGTHLTPSCQCHRAGQVAQLDTGETSYIQEGSVLPAKGGPSTLDIGSWNLEWFGDIGNGPTDETLQLRNAQAVIAATDLDVWGLTEIVNVTQWNALKSRLPGYTGLLASEVSLTSAERYYEDADQKLAILYKADVARLDDARLILTQYAGEFAGRPPLQATFSVTLNGLTRSVVVIVMHAKCCPEIASWQQRVNASAALKTYLDGTFPSQKVWVVGDFNDDIDESIASGRPSPYANFVTDGVNYQFATRALSDAWIASTVDHEEVIDHHLTTNEAAATLIAGSAEIHRVDRSIPDYGTTTSDHYPVSTCYRWGASSADETSGDDGGITDRPDERSADSGTNGAAVIINEIGANEPGSDTTAEFVELVNLGSRPVDVAGWTLHDATSTRHVFSAGFSIAPGKAVVVFSSTASGAGLENAVAASTGSLSLANTGDSVTLSNASGTVVDSYSYSSQTDADGVSINRTPDGNRDPAFVRHTFLSTLSQSPGKRVDGKDW